MKKKFWLFQIETQVKFIKKNSGSLIFKKCHFVFTYQILRSYGKISIEKKMNNTTRSHLCKPDFYLKSFVLIKKKKLL